MKAKTRAQLERLVSELSKSKPTPRVRKSINLKSQVIEEIKGLLRQYKVLAIASIDGVPSSESKRLYRKLVEQGALVRLYKNSLVLRALRELGAENLDELAKYLTGSNMYIFTNMNPFELAKVLETAVEYRFAKPDEVADFDVELTPGPTDIKPGPSLSLFGKLKIPTQVREGVIWIAKDTKVLKRGDKVSSELCSLLRKLGIRVVPVRIRLKVVYEGGCLYPPEHLKIDYEKFRNDLVAAIGASKALALELAFPVPELMPELLARAQRVAVELAASIGYITPETASVVVSKALARAYALAQALSGKVDLGVAVPTAPAAGPSKEEKKEKPEKKEEEEKKEVSEEEVAEGIASLFG
jgi:large subunit ribosomal protein L10